MNKREVDRRVRERRQQAREDDLREMHSALAHYHAWERYMARRLDVLDSSLARIEGRVCKQ